MSARQVCAVINKIRADGGHVPMFGSLYGELAHWILNARRLDTFLTQTFEVGNSLAWSCVGGDVKVHIGFVTSIQFNVPEERKWQRSSSAGLVGFWPFCCCCDLLPLWFSLVWMACCWCCWHLVWTDCIISGWKEEEHWMPMRGIDLGHLY